MPNTINLRLLDNKNIIAEWNGIPNTENSYKIIAGEENATIFKIISKPTQYEFAQYTVEMVNSQGYGIKADDLTAKNPNEYIIENDEFILPVGMAVAGYGWVQIRAYQDQEKVPFMPLKVKVWNTLPNWKDGISSGSSSGSSSGLTEQEKAKVDKLIIDGSGTKFLANDGKYKNPVVIDDALSVKGAGADAKAVGDALENKLDKDTSTTTLAQVYGKKTDGTQEMRAVSNSGQHTSIPYLEYPQYVGRTVGAGTFTIANPVNDYSPATKKYVDDARFYKHTYRIGFEQQGDDSNLPEYTDVYGYFLLALYSKSKEPMDIHSVCKHFESGIYNDGGFTDYPTIGFFEGDYTRKINYTGANNQILDITLAELNAETSVWDWLVGIMSYVIE